VLQTHQSFPGYILSDFFLWISLISLKQREAIISSKTFSILGYFRLLYFISEAAYTIQRIKNNLYEERI